MTGRTTANGYGGDHQKLRAEWKPKVEAGLVNCWRCGKRIQPGTPWDLGHDDVDRSRYRGPEHEACNANVWGNRRKQFHTTRPDPDPTPRTKW